MGLGGRMAAWGRAVGRILDLAAQPVRTAQGREGIVLQPYRGYGSREEAFLIGRVFHQSAPTEEGGAAALLRDIGRRIARRTVPGAVVTARFCGAEQRVETDRDGYFRIHVTLKEPPPDGSWHAMDLRLEGDHPVEAEGQIFIPPKHCRFVVISDIDDTVMHTGVANKLGMLWRLFVSDADSRTAFPGVAALYRALHDGVGGAESNPMLYVSRAPWGIYDVLDEFFKIHGVPVGPVLFLREWGMSWRSPLPRRAEDHKQALIRNMLDLYHDLPFVLIVDSCQHDPEVYRQIVEENPGRVLAVLIRNVSRGEDRVREMEALAMAVANAGSTMLVAADSAAMADQVAHLGLVAPGTVAMVEEEMAGEGGERTATRRVERPTAGGTAAAVAAGELRDAIGEGPDAPPPNVVVEPGGPPPAPVRPPPP